MFAATYFAIFSEPIFFVMVQKIAKWAVKAIGQRISASALATGAESLNWQLALQIVPKRGKHYSPQKQ